MKREERKSARRPMSYAGASDMGPWEGKRASPSNPTAVKKVEAGNAGKLNRDAVIVFRCTTAEKQLLRDRALRNGQPFAVTLRAALGLEIARRHKAPIGIDPNLVRALSQVSINLGMVARNIAASAEAGLHSTGPILDLFAHLISIDRSMQGIHSRVIDGLASLDGELC